MTVVSCSHPNTQGWISICVYTQRQCASVVFTPQHAGLDISRRNAVNANGSSCSHPNTQGWISPRFHTPTIFSPFMKSRLMSCSHPNTISDRGAISDSCRVHTPTRRVRYPLLSIRLFFYFSFSFCSFEKPARAMFMAALISRSCTTPHSGHVHSTSSPLSFLFNAPQAWQVSRCKQD